MNEWMDGCPAVWMNASSLAGWPNCLPTEQACKGTGAGLGNARHDMGTKLTTVSQREALSRAIGHKQSASLDVWTEG